MEQSEKEAVVGKEVPVTLIAFEIVDPVCLGPCSIDSEPQWVSLRKCLIGDSSLEKGSIGSGTN